MDYRLLIKRLDMPDRLSPPARLVHGEVVATAITRADLPDDASRSERSRRRVRQMQQHMRNLAAAGSAWEMELASRGVLDEGMLEVAWMEDHAMDLIQRPRG